LIYIRRIGLAAACLAALTNLAQADPSGLWREPDGGTVRIVHCGSGYCGTIASVNPPRDPATGKPVTDKNNADPAKRNRPVVGLPVLIGMRPAGPKKWSGRLYDIDRGQFFVGHLVEVDATTIRIEGCARSLCGGEDLTRVKR
jgi:uncharacterized protein (DUF2147 family)